MPFPYVQKCTGEHFLDWLQNKQTWQITQSLNEPEGKHVTCRGQLHGYLHSPAPLHSPDPPYYIYFLFTDRCFTRIKAAK